jgi:3',5'-cyclic AMP phosphodiesterase CpdA
MSPRLLHLSDLHFGRRTVPEQIAAAEQLIATETFDAIVITGDLSQRMRTWELERARNFVQLAESRAPVLVLPGNHDTAWWMAPMGIGSRAKMHERYRAYIRDDIEPVLRVPGATLVAVNSARGVQPYTLTTRLRDIGVVGAVRPEQWARARDVLAAAPAGDLRIVAMHHNLVRGRISNRWGLASRARGITDALGTGADLVLCGHDHEERVEQVSDGTRKMVIACGSTLCNRVRGGGPGSFNFVDADRATITVTEMKYNGASGGFARAKWARYTR